MLGNVHKGRPIFQVHLDPPTIPCPILSHFHVPTQKRMSHFDKGTPPPSSVHKCNMYYFSCLDIDNIITHKTAHLIEANQYKSHSKFCTKKLESGEYVKNLFPLFLAEKWDVLFWSTNQPTLSHFVPFCLTNQPSQKSDVLYGRSLDLSQ